MIHLSTKSTALTFDWPLHVLLFLVPLHIYHGNMIRDWRPILSNSSEAKLVFIDQTCKQTTTLNLINCYILYFSDTIESQRYWCNFIGDKFPHQCFVLEGYRAFSAVPGQNKFSVGTFNIHCACIYGIKFLIKIILTFVQPM